MPLFTAVRLRIKIRDVGGWIALGLASLLVALTLPGSAELLLLTLGAALPRRRREDAAPYPGKLAVVVPAHDEQVTVARCVASLRNSESGDAPLSIVVVADNCSDSTAESARAAGARVLERRDDRRCGKGYALQFAFERLLAEGVEAIAVVDADSVVDPNFVPELRRALARGADAVQVRYGVLNPDASRYTQMLHVAFLAFNVLRPRGRERWNLSAGILGNGFALTRETLLAVPWTATSLVEDLEYHLRLVRSHRTVRFADDTWVRAEMPTRSAAIAVQRARWEGGRWRLVYDRLPSLIGDLLRGRGRSLEPALELLSLPLTWHTGLLLALAALPVSATRPYALGALLLIAVHLLTALAIGGGRPRDLVSLALAPLYALRKIVLIPAIARMARRGAAWQRTPRSEPRVGGYAEEQSGRRASGIERRGEHND